MSSSEGFEYFRKVVKALKAIVELNIKTDIELIYNKMVDKIKLQNNNNIYKFKIVNKKTYIKDNYILVNMTIPKFNSHNFYVNKPIYEYKILYKDLIKKVKIQKMLKEDEDKNRRKRK